MAHVWTWNNVDQEPILEPITWTWTNFITWENQSTGYIKCMNRSRVHHCPSKRSFTSLCKSCTGAWYTLIVHPCMAAEPKEKFGTIWESCLMKACEVCIAHVNAGTFDVPLAWVTDVCSESPPLTASTLEAASFCCSEIISYFHKPSRDWWPATTSKATRVHELWTHYNILTT